MHGKARLLIGYLHQYCDCHGHYYGNHAQAACVTLETASTKHMRIDGAHGVAHV